MKITKKINKNNKTTTYFYNGIKKYEHYKDNEENERWSEFKDGNEIYYKNSNGYECWRDYKDEKEIHCKDNKGYEWWSDESPEKNIKPFVFSRK